MPIYEYYCHQCHTIYNFLSRTINTEKIPDCPTCKDVKLQRQVSVFAAISKRGEREGSGEDDLPPLDPDKMERAMGMLAHEAGHMNDDDPRQVVQLMRKLSDATELAMNPVMEEALNRMERGEDPKEIEEDLGDLLEGEEPFMLKEKGGKVRATRRPNVDETLYEL